MNRQIRVALVAIMMVLLAACGTKDNTGVLATGSTTSTVVTPTTVDFGKQKSADDCVAKYNVVLDKNAGNRILSEGLPKGKTPQQKLDFVMKKAQHDPRVLMVMWNVSPAGRKTPIKDVKELVDNGCYSEKGRDLYQRTLGVYEAATVVADVAPETGANTGANPGGNVFQEPVAPIAGDRSGIRTDFPNGDKAWVMDRCGNPVLIGPIPGLPFKPPPTTGTVPPGTNPPGSTVPPGTPTTRPTGTTLPNPTTTRPPCTVDHTGKCVSDSPVSSDPNDPNEPTRPNTTEPTRPPSTAPSTTQQSTVPAPTTTAAPAPAPTTTTAAPPPDETCEDPDGTGICEA